MSIIFMIVSFVAGLVVGALIYRNNAKRLQEEYNSARAELKKLKERIKDI